MTQRTARTILGAGLLAGVLDITAAFLLSARCPSPSCCGALRATGTRRKVPRMGLKKRARQALTEPIRGASVVAVAYLGLLGASFAILSRGPDLNTRTGRHLVAGALGIAALAVVEVLICAIPLRRGERWAHWAAAVPLFLLGIPIFVIDARFAPAHTRVATLLPQGIAVLFGLVLVLLSLARYFERREGKSG